MNDLRLFGEADRAADYAREFGFTADDIARATAGEPKHYRADERAKIFQLTNAERKEVCLCQEIILRRTGAIDRTKEERRRDTRDAENVKRRAKRAAEHEAKRRAAEAAEAAAKATAADQDLPDVVTPERPKATGGDNKETCSKLVPIGTNTQSQTLNTEGVSRCETTSPRARANFAKISQRGNRKNTSTVTVPEPGDGQMPLKIVTPPAAEPVTLEEVRDFARIDDSDQDSLLLGLITMAREQIEQATSRTFVETVWDLSLRDWPNGDGLIRLPRSPLINVAYVKHRASDGNLITLTENSDYLVDNAAEPGTVEPITSWPTVGSYPDAVQVRFTAGYQSTSSPTLLVENVPHRARIAICALVAHWHEQREPILIDGRVAAVPMHVDRLINSLRVWRQR